MKIRIAITDDHPIVTNGLKKILGEFAHLEIVDVFPSGKALLESIQSIAPDVLLLDMHLPDAEGPELAKKVLKLSPQTRILVLTSSDILVQVKKMLQIGCSGYVLKDADDLTIVKAIETVAEGGRFLSPGLEQRLVEDMFRTGHQEKVQLTRREKEVLQLIMQELTNQEIADRLFISLHTVDNHRSALLQKLNVKNTAGLVRKAIENGLVD